MSIWREGVAGTTNVKLQKISDVRCACSGQLPTTVGSRDSSNYDDTIASK